MQFSNPVRTDLVISMTLAETFLLLLFVVWSGVAAKLPCVGCETPDQIIAHLRRENKELKDRIAKLQEKLEDAEARLKWWREAFPQAVPWEGKPLPPGGGKGLVCGTGKPPCQADDNVLISGSVINGKTSVEVLTQCPALAQSLGEWGAERLRPGMVLQDRADIQRLLEGVRDYRITADGKATECRFTYRLNYCNYKDYFEGRQLFEKYFYGPGKLQTSCALPQ